MRVVDLQPIIAAVAALIVATTPAVASLLVSLANRSSLLRVEKATNGQLTKLASDVQVVRSHVEAGASRTSDPRAPEGGQQ